MGTIREEGVDMGKRNRRKKLQRVRGKKKKKRKSFSLGELRKLAVRRQSRAAGGMNAWGTSKSLQLIQGTAGSLWGWKKVMLWSTQLIWGFGSNSLDAGHTKDFHVRALGSNLLLTSHVTLGRFLDPYFP